MSTIYAVSAIAIAVSSIMVIMNSSKNDKVPTNDDNTYIHVEGTKLVDRNNNNYQIKGLNFGNNVWDRPVIMPTQHNTAASYKELSELGFNTVRFYLNYDLFESDEKPYKYRREGFTWIDKNIKWAKQYNIKLILDMHIPQGGALNDTTKLAFWTNSENQKRYLALWRKIADYYADEPSILGYGLLNEPYVPACSTADESLELMKNLTNDVKDEIRSVDSNHIIFLERPYGCINVKTGAKSYPWGDTGSFFLLDDKNVVYEYHIYEPVEFTHQGLNWSVASNPVQYGDTRVVIPKGKNNRVVESTTFNAMSNNDNWINYVGPLYQLTDDANNGFFQLYIDKLGAAGNVFIDDIVIKEYNSAGEYIRDLYTNQFDQVVACSYWAPNDNKGKVSYNKQIGYTKPGSITVSGTTDTGIVYENENIQKYFAVEKGNYYQVCAKILFKNSQDTGMVRPSIRFNKAETVYKMNSEFLEYQINKFITFSNNNNVPIYMGEFGTSIPTFSNNLGGEQWVNDMLTIIAKYNLNFGYHDFHEESFGYYMDKGTQKCKKKNKVLESLFKEYISTMK